MAFQVLVIILSKKCILKKNFKFKFVLDFFYKKDVTKKKRQLKQHHFEKGHLELSYIEKYRHCLERLCTKVCILKNDTNSKKSVANRQYLENV